MRLFKNRKKTDQEKKSYSKYKNEKETIDGITFDSRLEARFYIWLLAQHKKTEIIVQPKFLLQEKFRYQGKGIREIAYIADFQVGETVYDVKGLVLEVYKVKAKIFKHKYPDLILYLVKYKNGQWVYS